MQVKYFRFLQSFLPQDRLLKKLWICSNKDVNQTWENNARNCQNVIVRRLWLDFPGVFRKNGPWLGVICAFSDEKCKDFWKCKNVWRWWKDERAPKKVFWLLLKSSYVTKSRDDSWHWPSLCEKLIFSYVVSLPWTFVTLQTFSYPVFSVAFSFCASLCFVEGLLASLACKSTKQFPFHFSWLFFTWLNFFLLSSHQTLFNSLPSLNEYSLSFSDRDERVEVLVAWSWGKANLTQSLM